VVTCPAG